MEVLQQRNTELEKELTDANQQIAQLKSEKEEIAKRISTNFFIQLQNNYYLMQFQFIINAI